MRAVTFQAPGEIRVDEKPEPELTAPGEAIVRVEASGVCGSDLHIYHGRVAIEPGFTIGHEYVGTVTAVGDDVSGVAEGDRVLGTYCTACNECFFCRRGDFHKCDSGPGLRPRQAARRAPGRPGRAAPGPERRPGAAARSRRG